MEKYCKFCNEFRRTTNVENPYVCEECLRTTGRDLMLSDLKPAKTMRWDWVLWFMVIAFFLGVAFTNWLRMNG